jgi:hypothetical protein
LERIARIALFISNPKILLEPTSCQAVLGTEVGRLSPEINGQGLKDVFAELRFYYGGNWK